MGPIEWLLLGVVGLGSLVASLIVAALGNGRWVWILGFVACFGIGAAITPADPLSMLIVAAPLCCLYPLVVFLWKSPRAAPGMPVRENPEPTANVGSGG